MIKVVLGNACDSANSDSCSTFKLCLCFLRLRKKVPRTAVKNVVSLLGRKMSIIGDFWKGFKFSLFFLISNSVDSISICFHLAQYFILEYGLINILFP